MLWKRMRSPAALSTLGFFSTVPIGFNRSPLSSVIKKKVKYELCHLVDAFIHQVSTFLSSNQAIYEWECGVLLVRVSLWGISALTMRCQVLWRRLLTCEVFLKRSRCRRRQGWKYQEQMAKWTRGTPQSSAGSCSQTPWCSPRLWDSPEERDRED